MIKKHCPILELISGNEGKYHVSRATTMEFEKSILKCGIITIATKSKYYISWITYRFWIYLFQKKIFKNTLKAIMALFLYQHRNYMVVLMGPNYQKCFPYFFRRGLKAIYLFDAWPMHYNNIIRFINDFSVDYVFISSLQSTNALNILIGKNNVFWVPEGVNPEDYRYYTADKKDIDILSFGRRYQPLHKKIVEPLLKQNIDYRYSIDGQMVFPDRESFIEGLAKTKISICYPSNITHSERAGNVETLTHRYLQSMVSKCLIVGKAPKEMIDCFGYNPVIDIDMINPVCQIMEILKEYKIFEDLIEKNYTTVLKNHIWARRWESISEILS